MACWSKLLAQGHERINDTSIGIEIVNPAFEVNAKNNDIVWLPYSERQINSVISLCKQIIARYDIKPTRVVGHSDIAPGRKPGPWPVISLETII